MSQNVMIRFQ